MYIKVCGITSVEDAQMIFQLPINAVGSIVNVPMNTPRNIDLSQARTISDFVFDIGKIYVAVTMPKTFEEVREIEKRVKPSMIQLHGMEEIKLLKKIKENTSSRIIKAFHVDKDFDYEYLMEASDFADLILLDTKVNGKSGGTGQTHDYEVDLKVKKSVHKPLIVAGGLNPSNVRQVIQKVKPYGIDVSSGLESTPGVKDPDLVKKFFGEIEDE